MASDNLERDLTKASVGYLSKEDYKRKREDLEADKALAALKRIAGGGSSTARSNTNAPPAASTAPPGVEAPPAGSEVPGSDNKKKKAKSKAKAKAKSGGTALSFGDELDEEEEATSPGTGRVGGMSAAREKEAQQAASRQEAAMREVLQQQLRAKQEPLTLQYTYRSAVTQREQTNGVHRGSVTIKRGFSAEEAAVAVRLDVEKLGGKFAPNSVQGIKEERDVLLIVCCEGVPNGSFVVPGAVGLPELWNRRWSDVPQSMFDEFKHGVVVTERRYYEQQRHVFPYSHWRQYDTLTDYSHKEFVATRNEAAHQFIPTGKNGEPKGQRR